MAKKTEIGDVLECMDDYSQLQARDSNIIKTFKDAVPCLLKKPAEIERLMAEEKRQRAEARERKKLLKRCKRHVCMCGILDDMPKSLRECVNLDDIASEMADRMLEERRSRPKKILDITRRWLTVDGVEYWGIPNFRLGVEWRKAGSKCALPSVYQQQYFYLYQKAKSKKIDHGYLNSLNEWMKDEKLTEDQVNLLKAFAVQYRSAKVSCMDELGFLQGCYYASPKLIV